MKKLFLCLLLLLPWRCPAPILYSQSTTNNAYWLTNASAGGITNTYSALPLWITTPGFVGGGIVNQAIASNTATLGGAGNIAHASESVAIGGHNNDAEGTNSFAAGTRSTVLHDGVFMWSDGQNKQQVSTTNNQFVVRAQNGLALYEGSYYGNGVGLTNLVQFWTNDAGTGGISNVINGTVTIRGDITEHGNINADVSISTPDLGITPGDVWASGAMQFGEDAIISGAGILQLQFPSAVSVTNLLNVRTLNVTNTLFVGGRATFTNTAVIQNSASNYSVGIYTNGSIAILGVSNTAGFTVYSNQFAIFGGQQIASPTTKDYTNIFIGVNNAGPPFTGPGNTIAMPDQGGVFWKSGASIYDQMNLHVSGRALLLINGGTDIQIESGSVASAPHPAVELGTTTSSHEWIKLKTDSISIDVTNNNVQGANPGYSKALMFDPRGVKPFNGGTIYNMPGIVGYANPYSPTNYVDDGVDGSTGPGGGELRFYGHVPDFTSSYPFNTNYLADHNPGLEILRMSTNGVSLMTTNGGLQAKFVTVSNAVTFAMSASASVLTNVCVTNVTLNFPSINPTNVSDLPVNLPVVSVQSNDFLFVTATWIALSNNYPLFYQGWISNTQPFVRAFNMGPAAIDPNSAQFRLKLEQWK
jgi:hypothetical protein